MKARLALLCVLALGFALRGGDPASAQTKVALASWNDGKAREAILAFVEKVTNPGSPDFVPPARRIATFDNDGTLWVEQPLYTQLRFAIDRVQELAPRHPEWKSTQPFQAVLEGDTKTALASGEKGVVEMVVATHAGMTADEFTGIVTQWIGRSKHPRFERLYTECVYQPQLELLRYLRDNEFKTFIVSGGGIEFMRPWTDRVYGVPPWQVVGSSIVTEFEIRDGKPVLVRQPKVNFIDDKAGKPVGIQQHIGFRPILAFGNSDGDLQMIQYAKGGDGATLGVFLHHTDAEREYAYDRKSPVGKLDQVLDMAPTQDWIIVDMKRDWRVVFPWEKR